jgi:hypothetical protein
VREQSRQGGGFVQKLTDPTVSSVVVAEANLRVDLRKFRTTNQLIHASGYDWSNNAINSRTFQLRYHVFVHRELTFVQLTQNTPALHAVFEIVKQNLKIPLYEHALAFGWQCGNNKTSCPSEIIFPHRPVKIDDFRCVLRIDKVSTLSLHLETVQRGRKESILAAGTVLAGLKM